MDHYGTLEGALSYHSLRGNTQWLDEAATEGQRTAALIRASAALDGVYGSQFGGIKAGGRAQVLAWPREGAHDSCADEVIPADEVPQGVLSATYELALAELITPNALTPNVTPGRLVKRQKVDSIEREFFGSDEGATVESMRPVLVAAKDALRCVLFTPKAEAAGSTFLLRY